MIALSEARSKQRLGPGLPMPSEALTLTPGDARRCFDRIPAPYVAKASGIAHKSDLGLVRVGLDAAGVLAVWDELAAAGDGTVLVASQVRADFELIVGAHRDPQFGVVLTVGLGGVATEVFQDCGFLLHPFSMEELERALGRLRSAPLFSGFRGAPAVERTSLAAVLAHAGNLLLHDPDVTEVDLNPVAVVAGRLLVLDALVVLGVGPGLAREQLA